MKEKDRAYNLDLLRIISMLMIVCLHLNSHGGMLVKYNALNFYGIFFNTLEVLCVVAVNIFVLISGYFLCSQQFRLSRIFKLMLQTLFYSWMCLIITFKFNLTPLDIHLLMRGILPVLYGNYWFVTAYVGMYALSPYINTFLNNISEQQHRATIFFMIICTSIINDCLPGERFLAVSGGYSVIWFVVLYIIAAYLRKYGVSCSKFRNIAIYIYFLSSVLILLSWIVLRFFLGNIGITQHFYRYNSLLVLLASVALFTIFTKITICGDKGKRIIACISPLTFGVYLLHDNPCLRAFIWTKVFCTQSLPTTVMLPLKALSIVLVIFVGCILIDFVRWSIFKRIENTRIYHKIICKIDNVFNFTETD